LRWPDAGLRLRYHVYLQGPGEPGGAPVKITLRTGATITGLRPGDYQATVTPVNFKKQTGRAAKVTFTVP
jgi:predicted phage tail protein